VSRSSCLGETAGLSRLDGGGSHRAVEDDLQRCKARRRREPRAAKARSHRVDDDSYYLAAALRSKEVKTTVYWLVNLWKLKKWIVSNRTDSSLGANPSALQEGFVFSHHLCGRVAALSGCNRTGEESDAYPIAYNTSGLPNVTLTDQYGQHVPLASLKGKPVLFDFIYTSCPGPCQLLTQHMKLSADKLGPALDARVPFGAFTRSQRRDRSRFGIFSGRPRRPPDG
jgi:hypothetical protein